MSDGMKVAQSLAGLIEKIATLEEEKSTGAAAYNAEIRELREQLRAKAKDIQSGQVNWIESIETELDCDSVESTGG